jgi:hypothetical protein
MINFDSSQWNTIIWLDFTSHKHITGHMATFQLYWRSYGGYHGTFKMTRKATASLCPKWEFLKNTQNDKFENVADSAWLSLLMDGNGKCKLPSTPPPPSTGLSRIQYLNMKWQNFEFRNIRRCVHTTVNMKPSKWHVRVIPWKATESVCTKRENNGRN